MEIFAKISLTELVKWLVLSKYYSTHILQCTRAHNCTGYHLLFVNENLCLSEALRRLLNGVR